MTSGEPHEATDDVHKDEAAGRRKSLQGQPLRNFPYTSPVVIVNKDATPKKPRVLPEEPAELELRYRITLDNSGLDKMKL